MLIGIKQTGTLKSAGSTWLRAGLRLYPASVLLMGLVVCLVPTRVIATDFCSQTADLVFRACGHEAEDDFLIASAKCINISDQAERGECFADAKSTRSEDRKLCQEQLATRINACKVLGQERYDPDFDPADFDKDFSNLPNPNPYFPLRIGNRWEYRGGNEVNTVEVLNRTKLIDGVRCVVVRDLVAKSGFLVEATDDWYAQAKDGNVWYCGEEVKDFETFQGDRPKLPEMVSIDGSFKAGRDNDKPGIIFLASPEKGKVHRRVLIGERRGRYGNSYHHLFFR